MGNTKDNMKPTTETGKALFGNIASKWRGKKDQGTVQDAPKAFVDHVTEAYEALAKLILQKEVEFSNEKGSELANSRKLAYLKSMGFHLESVMDLAVTYEAEKGL